MKDIDLYFEAKPRYHQLIPNKEDGLVLLALYQTYQQTEFTEEQIINIIHRVYTDLGKSGQRTEYERNNNIVLRLQDFFLWRDRKRKVYGFKKYGEEFCLKIHKRLSESYHPAKIERLFKELLDTLQLSLQKEPPELLIWIDDHFDQRSIELALQIEILDQQVSEAVNDFRKQIKQPQTDVLQLIEMISMGLDNIKQHAHELTSGFQFTYDIDDLLQDMLKKPENFSLLTPINQVLKYNKDVRNHLDQVSIRIDKIKPRIREFIFEFNQRELDRKTEQFIDYLLDNTTYTRKENLSKRLVFPAGVEPIQIKSETSIPRFYIVQEKDFAQKAPIKSTARTIDAERTQIMLEKSKLRLELKNKVMAWVNTAVAIVEETGKLEFSPFFFNILTSEDGNLNIAVKTAQRVIKQCSNRRIYQIEIDENEYHDPFYLNLSLWNMTILRKN